MRALDMNLQMIHISKSLAAVLALVRPRLAVAAAVTLQSLLGPVNPSAFIAGEP